MDVKTSKFYQSQSHFSTSSSHGVSTATEVDTKVEIETPVCKLISNKASDCYRPMHIQTTATTTTTSSSSSSDNSGSSMETRPADILNFSTQRKKLESPLTPGRPVFSFSVAKKTFPSKWDDAQKWLSNSCHESPAHPIKPSSSTSFEVSRVSSVQCDGNRQQLKLDEFDEKFSRVSNNQKVLSFNDSVAFEQLSQQHQLKKKLNPTRKYGSGVSSSVEVFLKDKFAERVESVFTQTKYTEPCTEGFMFKNNSSTKQVLETSKEVILEVQHRDIGTEMTPLGSSTTSRCPTPYKSSSPARHNTPADRSGPLPMSDPSSGSSSSIDISQLQKCHLAKLQLGTQYNSMMSNWSSRQEEEEDVSKSLRHFDNGFRKSYSETRTTAWEEEEKTKCCLRYQREEAKIQAWINLQNAKAEAQSRKLEVKIERMRSNLEEKLMKRMAVVHKKAEEWRAEAQVQHSVQIKKSSDLARKFVNKHPHFPTQKVSCGCLPCNNNFSI